MKGSSAVDIGRPSYTLDRAFGVRGPLRLVPQGNAPKAHILLKREISGEDDTEDEPTLGTARFTFVANKRFTASKGQTLLVSVIDPKADDQSLLLDDHTISFEFEFDDGEVLSEVDEEEDIEEIERARWMATKKERKRRDVDTLPPKMRKSLIGTKTYVDFVERAYF